MANRKNPRKPKTAPETNAKQGETALRESEERFRALVEFAPVAIVVIDADGRIVLVNASAEELFGYERDELIGQPLEILLPERLRDAHVLHRVRYFSDPQVRPMGARLDFMGQRKDGTEFAIDCALSFAELAGGVLSMAFATDITERKRAEGALRASEAVLRATMESTADGILVVDNQWRVMYINRRFADMWSLPDGLLETRDLNKLIPIALGQVEDPEALETQIRSVHPSDEVAFDTVRLKDGRVFEQYSLPLLIDGDVAGRVVSMRDITARRRAEEALRQSEERFRRVFEEGPLGMAIVSPDFRLSEVNSQMCDMLGYTADELTALTFPDITHPDDLETDVQLADQLFRGEIPRYQIEKRFLRKSGDTMWGEVSASLVRGEDGTAQYGLGMVEDITERKRAEEALRASEAVLRATMESTADGTLVVDNQWRVLHINRRFADMWGLPDGLLETRDLNRLLPIALGQVEDPEALATQIRSVHPSDEVTFDVVRLNDGRVFEQYSLPLLVGGEVAGRVVSMRDITARRRAEEALVATRDELEGKVERQMVRRNRYGLTFREFTVLNLVAAGKADKEIALELGISLLTVHKHVGAILGKMHASSRTDAAARALREGLLE